jgi:hypothetical protein
MTRTRLAAAVAAAAVLVLSGCGGQGDASQSDVRNSVRDTLNEEGYTDPDGTTFTFDADEADEGAECVSAAIFESDDITPDQRNDIARATNGDDPDPEVVALTETIVADCLDGLGTIEDS